MERRTALGSPHDRSNGGFILSEGQAGALDSCARCDGRCLSAERSAMRQSALLCNGATFSAGGGIRCTAGFHFVPMQLGIFLDTILAVAVLACLAEIPFGKYRNRV